MTLPPSDRPWRVVIVSRILPVVVHFDELVRAAGHTTVGVLCVPSPWGRPLRGGFRDNFLALAEHLAPELDFVVPSSRERIAALLGALEPDLVLCAACPWRIPADALAVPPLGAVNSHPSPLPRYRGPQPMAWMVRNGETEAALTFHRMVPELDAGPILAQASFPFDLDESEEELWPRFGALTAELLPHVFERLAAGDPGDEQGDGDYQSFFDDDYVWIDWSRPAAEVHRQVRAWRFAVPVGTEEGALAELDGERVRILRTSLEPVDGARPVECGDAPLWIVQTEAAAAGAAEVSS
jgi:methionyl-tRNA formyltransferase